MKPVFGDKAQAIKAYKIVIFDALQNCPLGTKRRIAEELGTGMSFVSQISNPNYAIPIPSKHVERILDICALSEQDKAAFRAAYKAAHTSDDSELGTGNKNMICIPLPKFKNAAQRRKAEEAIRTSAETILQLMTETKS